jgi:hypothetical protein
MMPSDSHPKVTVRREEEVLWTEASLVLAPTILRTEKSPMQEETMQVLVRN